LSGLAVQDFFFLLFSIWSIFSFFIEKIFKEERKKMKLKSTSFFSWVSLCFLRRNRGGKSWNIERRRKKMG
jgi:hypothetical protein